MRCVVTGSPNSGKTTYVNSHKSNDAIVWDADDLVRVMCGADRHAWPSYMMPIIGSMLDGFIRGIPRGCRVDIWVIVTEEHRARAVARVLGADVIAMDARD